MHMLVICARWTSSAKEFVRYVEQSSIEWKSRNLSVNFQGDSGGPLVLDDELVGIANWIEMCGAARPDGYAKISYFYDWIEKNIQSQ